MAIQYPKLMGARVKRREDPRLITGNATYVDDVKLPGMQWMAVVRSPYANARITRIDVSRARQATGVTDVITAAEVKEISDPVPIGLPLPGQQNTVHWALSEGQVRHVGDPVVAVLATDRYAAADAADLVEIDYEPLPAIVDVEQAAQDGAVRVYDELPNNIAYVSPVNAGDAEAAFRNAEVSISQ